MATSRSLNSDDTIILPLQPALPGGHRPGDEPVPGYRLREPLGQGGFGEVWSCEAPGGLAKAIKFVRPEGPGGSPAAQELRALTRVKAIRHPFILSLDRLEVIDGVLTIVMELADQSLEGLMVQCQAEGLAGIPRGQLLKYLLEVADALDWMNFEHGLQHLDIKPPNLFVVAGHAKVADFGLVDLVDAPSGAPVPLAEGTEDPAPRPGKRRRGLTPLYTSPERLRGNVSGQSDQYSLAIVYQQLLTGTAPFWSPNGYQVMVMHLTEPPLLTPLPPEDRPAVGRALAKDPGKRFASCREFVQALTACTPQVVGLSAFSTDPPETVRAERPTGAPQPSQGDGADRESVTKSVRVRGNPPSAEAPQEGKPGQADRPNGPTPAMTPPRAIPRPALPASSGLVLPGYHNLKCHAKSLFADLWSATAPDGTMRRALSLSGAVCADPELSSRLQALMHPALPPTEILYNPDGRLVLITDPLGKTLRDRFLESREEGKAGIPREELVEALGHAAELLDLLREDLGLAHLGLNPSNLFYQGGRVHVADYGLLALAAGPAGMATGPFNPRYAAPELGLRDEPAGPGVDQFALALIYAEMLTGVAPRPLRKGTPPHRITANGRPEINARSITPGGGRHRPVREGLAQNVRSPRVAARFDLDLLPSHDRAVIARALSEDPDRRFRCLKDLAQALKDATPGVTPRQPPDHLPPVIPFQSLLGVAPPQGIALPTTGQFIESLTIQTPSQSVGHGERGSGPFAGPVGPDGIWEATFPFEAPSEELRTRIQGFVRLGNARLLGQERESWRIQVDLGASEIPPECGGLARPEPLVADIHVRRQASRRPPANPDHRPVLVSLNLTAPHTGLRGKRLRDKVTELLERLASCLTANPEQRSHPRTPCMATLTVYPVLPNLKVGEAAKGVGKDVSLGGICFRVPNLLPSDRLYLHWPHLRAGRDFAVLARVVRVTPLAEAVEIGAYFPGARSLETRAESGIWRP